MSDTLPAGDLPFVAGFAVRHAMADEAVQRAFTRPAGFATVDLAAPARATPGGPKHFSPAAPGHKPCAGWDPLDAQPVDQSAEPLVAELVDAAREDGFAAGYAAALAEIDAARGRDAALVASVAEALGSRFDADAMAARLRATVLALVTKVIGEAGVSAERLAARVAAATDLLAQPSESALLRVHPDDVALLDGHLPATVFAAGDPHVARGSFVLESASTVVEDGPALWLEQLGAAIDRAPLPRIADA